MKKTILMITVIASFAGAVLFSCQSSTEKMDNAKDAIVDAKQELTTALNDSIQVFRKEAETKLLIHEKSIKLFKTKIGKESAENKAMYEKKLATLEQKQIELKKTLMEYSDEEVTKLDVFKKEFNADMEALGKAIKGFVIKG